MIGGTFTTYVPEGIVFVRERLHMCLSVRDYTLLNCGLLVHFVCVVSCYKCKVYVLEFGDNMFACNTISKLMML